MAEVDLAHMLKACLDSGIQADWEAFIGLAQPVIASLCFEAYPDSRTPRRELADDLVQDNLS